MLLCPCDSPGKNNRVGFYSLLQGIFLTQGLNPGLPHCRQILYHLSHQGSPYIQLYVHIYPLPLEPPSLLLPTPPHPCHHPTSLAHHRALNWVPSDKAGFLPLPAGEFCSLISRRGVTHPLEMCLLSFSCFQRDVANNDSGDALVKVISWWASWDDSMQTAGDKQLSEYVFTKE